MSCTQYRRDIALLVGAELDAARRRFLTAHLDECPACRAFADELGATHALLRELAAVEADPALAAAVRARVMLDLREQQQDRSRLARAAWRWLAGATAAAVILVVASLAVRAGRPGGRTLDARAAHAPIATATPEHDRGEATQGAAGARQLAGAVTAAAPSPAPRQRRTPGGGSASAIRAPAAEQAVIKILTDDPEVVIYCIVDEREG